MTNIYNPSASVIIYNYRDRLGTLNIDTEYDSVDQVVISSASLISVVTNKSKSTPTGTFEITVAPTKNWTGLITPGSWCVILMGREPIRESDINGSTARAKESTLRMVGKIDSVRQVASVSQNGAISNTFVISGFDWGCVFNSFLYVDPASRTDNDNNVGAIERLLYDKIVTSYGDPTTKLKDYNSTSAINALLEFWGTSDLQTNALNDVSSGKLLGKAKNEFSIPKELAKYLGFVDDQGKAITKIYDLIKVRSGILIAKDTYSGVDKKPDSYHSDGYGHIQPATIFGMNSMWQLMMENSNDTVNEMLCDIRFESSRPLFTLYKRVRPFRINTLEDIVKDRYSSGDGKSAPEVATSFLRKLFSDFKYIRSIEIPEQDIISINAGTNWRDRYNFTEVILARQFFEERAQDAMAVTMKMDMQFFDKKSVRRDGLSPISMGVKYLPINENNGTNFIETLFAYKYLAKEWYFNTHKMLNGSLTILGQDKYIQVGDNILIPIKVISSNFNLNTKTKQKRQAAYLLAHVENITNRASVDGNGARSFTTSIQFVRGVIADSSGNPFSQDATQMLDQDTSLIQIDEERNSDRIFGTSSQLDPDSQKLRGR